VIWVRYSWKSSCGHLEHLKDICIRELLTATPVDAKGNLPPPFLGRLQPNTPLPMARGDEGNFIDNYGPYIGFKLNPGKNGRPKQAGRFTVKQTYQYNAPWTGGQGAGVADCYKQSKGWVDWLKTDLLNDVAPQKGSNPPWWFTVSARGFSDHWDVTTAP